MKRYLLLSVIVFSATIASAEQNLPLKLWYNKPATYFEESLPIGNGKLGALIYGDADNDSIYLNDITLWTGKPIDENEGGNKYENIPAIRKALFNEKYKEADSIQQKMQGHNSEYYQPLATLHIIDNNNGTTTKYYRELNLDSALAKISYTKNGINYKKEYFASNPDKVIAIHFTTDKPKSINCKLLLTSQVPHSVKASKSQIALNGYAIGDPDNSIHFCSILRIITKDGEINATDSTLHLSNASDATIYFINETSFNGLDKNPVNEGADYLGTVTNEAWHLINYTYNELRQRHINDYQRLFSRLTLRLGNDKYDEKNNTEQQLKEYTDNKGKNSYLETLYFQYGRYLLISSSRTTSVPANLQGLWTPFKYSPWRGNYTVNINLEENYWMAEEANLSEMTNPLNGFIKALSTTGKYTAQHFYGIDEGWCSSHNSDIWAMSNPVGTGNENPKWANWNMGGAWLVETLWEHFDFTQDKTYLRNTAYPLMKGAADFMLKWLIDNPKNPKELITAPSTSPEAEYITDKGYKGSTLYGGTADLAIIRELLINTKKAASILNTDTTYQNTLETTINRLRPYHIGKRGNLMEWYYDWNDQDWQHRHQSHLIGLFPGHHITLSDTPELARACKKTLEIKGDQTTGWSTGWRMNLWARLHDGDQAYHIFQKLLTYVSPDKYNGPDKRRSGGTYPNLFDAHPPFQIDGNFGGTAGVCEMLVQSGYGYIELLPAIPDSWSDGEINGICARGGYSINMKWKNKKVTRVQIKSKQDSKVRIIYNGKEKVLNFKQGQTKTL